MIDGTRNLTRRLGIIVLVVPVFAAIPPLASAQMLVEPSPSEGATALAITGVQQARWWSRTSGPGYWIEYAPSRRAASAGVSVLQAWLQEQRLAFEISRGISAGALGWGPAGIHTGYYGFGLSFHPGYGHGGCALGAGPFGGEPYYGGPGYPTCGMTYDGGPAVAGAPGSVIKPEYSTDMSPSDPRLANAGMGAAASGRVRSAASAAPYFGTMSGEGSGTGYHGGFGPYTGASNYPSSHVNSTARAAATGSVFDPFSHSDTSSAPPAIVPGRPEQ